MIIQGGGHNLYADANNNPANYIDPEGLFLGAAIGAGLVIWGAAKIFNAALNWLNETSDAFAKNKTARIADVVDPASRNYDPNFRENYADSICRIGEATGEVAKAVYGEAAGGAGDVIDMVEMVTSD